MRDSFILGEVISCAVVVLAFLYGAVFLFNRKTPMYFKLAVCSIGCFALEEFYNLMCLFCIGHYIYPFSIGSFGYAGSFAFLFAANFGSFDSIFSDRAGLDKKRKAIALIIPALLTAALVYMLVYFHDDFFVVLLAVLIYASAVPAAYYNLKIVLLKAKDDPFLKAVKPMNWFSLIYCIAGVFMLVVFTFNMEIAWNLLFDVMAICSVGMMIAAAWGRKKWSIQ